MTETLARAVRVTRRFGPTVALDGVDLGVTPQETGLPATLRVGEVLDFVARHSPTPLSTGDVLERSGSVGWNAATGGLSGGQKRRLAVALAFVGNPRLVVLDAPTTGLNVEARRALWDGVRAFHAGGGTVLLTSHYLDEIEELADRVVVVGAGRVLADGDTRHVRRLVGLSLVELRSPGLPTLPGVARSARDGDRYRLHTADPDELVRDPVRSGASFRDLQVRPASLEEALLTLTGEEAAE